MFVFYALYYCMPAAISMFGYMACKPYDEQRCNGGHIVIFGLLWPILVPIVLIKNLGIIARLIKDIVS